MSTAIIQIEREIPSEPQRYPCTRGKLTVRDGEEGEIHLALETLEHPWADNAQNVSCIPPGEYPVERRTVGGVYARYKERFGHEHSIWVRNVPLRGYILIHVGNTLEDTRGCPLVGLKRGYILGRPAVVSSVSAYRMLYRTLNLYPKWLLRIGEDMGQYSISEGEDLGDRNNL